MADTDDETIGASVKKDFKSINALVKKIADNTGMTLNLASYEGNDYTSKTANRAIKSITPDSNDTVFVYISAHGARLRSTPTKFPMIYFPDDVSIDQNTIYKTLAAKKPRLLIIIADVCNGYMEEGEPVPNVIPRTMSSNEQLNYTTLFVNSKGTILASSSKPGQYSMAFDKGGAYTLNFLSALKKATESASVPKWEDIMKTSIKPIYPESKDRQDPQYQMISFTEGGRTNNPSTTVSNKRLTFNFSEGKLEEKNAKKWSFLYQGDTSNLNEYDRSPEFIYLRSEDEQDYYAIDFKNKILYEYDWEGQEWNTLADDLK
jgi:hypothetical protein